MVTTIRKINVIVEHPLASIILVNFPLPDQLAREMSLYHCGRSEPPLARRGSMLQGIVKILYIIKKEGLRFYGD